MVFTRTYCAAPGGSPSRFALLTGRQSVRSLYAIERTLKTTSGALGTNITVCESNITDVLAKLLGGDALYSIPSTLSSSVNAHNKTYYTGMVGKWDLMTGDDNGLSLGCDELDFTPDAALYAACKAILYTQGFDWVDAWYHSNMNAEATFNHNPEWMV